MSFHAGQAFLGFVQHIPCSFDRNVKGTVGHDVPAAEEIVVTDTDPVQCPLHHPQRIRVVIDALDDGCLVLNVDPAAGYQRIHCLAGIVVPLERTVRVKEVFAIVSLEEEFIRVVEMHHHPEADVWVGLMEIVQHGKESFIKTFRVEGHFLAAQADGFHASFGKGSHPGADLPIGQHHWVAT